MRRLTMMGTAALAALLGAECATAQQSGPGPLYGPGMGRAPQGDDLGGQGPFQSYHGFRIDLGQAQGNVDVPSAVQAVEGQIDIVDRAGLSPEMMDAFRAVPIRINVTFMQGSSHYSGGPEVALGSLQVGNAKPILLHEYMHVLEYREFPGGFRNPVVKRFYDEAQTKSLFPSQSYMMSNPWEYFAMTASCYLNGTVAREPFTRAEIRERQPDLYAYLERLFGPRGG